MNLVIQGKSLQVDELSKAYEWFTLCLPLFIVVDPSPICWYVIKLLWLISEVAMLSMYVLPSFLVYHGGSFWTISVLICGNFSGPCQTLYVRYLKEFLGRQRDRHSRHLVQCSTWKFLSAWFIAFLQLGTGKLSWYHVCTFHLFYTSENGLWPFTHDPRHSYYKGNLIVLACQHVSSIVLI